MLSINRLLFAEALFAAAKTGTETLLSVKLPNIGKDGSSALWASYNNITWELVRAIRECSVKGVSGPFLDRCLAANTGLREHKHMFGGRRAASKVSDPAVAVAAAQSGGIEALRILAEQSAVALALAEKGLGAEQGGARKGARYVAKGSKGKVAPKGKRALPSIKPAPVIVLKPAPTV